MCISEYVPKNDCWRSIGHVEGCAVFGRLGAHSLGCASDPALIPGTAGRGALAIYRTMRRGSRGGRGRRVIDGDRGSAVVRPATVKGATCRQGGIRRRLCLSCPGPRRRVEGVSRRLGAPASDCNKRVSTKDKSDVWSILPVGNEDRFLTGVPNFHPSLKSEAYLTSGSRNELLPLSECISSTTSLGALLWNRSLSQSLQFCCSAVKSDFGGAIIIPVKEEGASDVEEGSSNAEEQASDMDEGYFDSDLILVVGAYA